MPGVLQSRNIAFVGAGHMAEALIRGLLESGAASPARVRASEIRAARRQEIHQRYGIEVIEDSTRVAAWADLVVLAVKPQAAPAVLESLRSSLSSHGLVVSILAGVSASTIERALPNGTRVIRAMPNTPAMVRAGATAIAGGTRSTADDLQAVKALFDAVGETVVVPETCLDAVTGLSGSGPAYLMLVIEALAEGGVATGLAPDVARRLAAQTVFGAAKLQIETNEDPAVLRQRVTSPGGTTVAGLAVLETAGVRTAFAQAVQAATQRATELGATEFGATEFGATAFGATAPTKPGG